MTETRTHRQAVGARRSRRFAFRVDNVSRTMRAERGAKQPEGRAFFMPNYSISEFRLRFPPS